MSSQTFCLGDRSFGDCQNTDLCSHDYRSSLDESVTPEFSVTVSTTPYTNSELPEEIDISALDDGDYELCVSASEVLPAPTTVTFTKLDSDPDDGSVRDEVSANLQITRSSNRGVLNLGTDQVQWAAGTCAAPTSSFYSSHSTMLQIHFRPVNVNLPGSDTCLFDVTTNTFYDVLWDSWSCCGAGGFAYTRTGPIAGPLVAVQDCTAFTKSGEDRIVINGQCNQAPICSAATASIDTLWPPNHKFVPVDVLGVVDPDGDPITITVDSIFQDEPTDTFGDGNFTPDGRGVGTATADVRAERSGSKEVPGDGRVYHIGFTADDGRAGQCSGEVSVGVPHDQGEQDAPVDGGAEFDSTLSE
jgi:hypothetical protein